jgi:putative ATPase
VTDQLFNTPEPDRGAPAAAPDAPLAARMRPERLDEVVGQQHLLGEGTALRKAIDNGTPHSMILFGPPGTGKTTIARLVAREADHAFEELSAVQAGRPEVREVMASAAGAGRARSSSLTRSIASTRPSRTRCCRRSRTAPSS